MCQIKKSSFRKCFQIYSSFLHKLNGRNIDVVADIRNNSVETVNDGHPKDLSKLKSDSYVEVVGVMNKFRAS